MSENVDFTYVFVTIFMFLGLLVFISAFCFLVPLTYKRFKRVFALQDKLLQNSNINVGYSLNISPIANTHSMVTTEK